MLGLGAHPVMFMELVNLRQLLADLVDTLPLFQGPAQGELPPSTVPAPTLPVIVSTSTGINEHRAVYYDLEKVFDQADVETSARPTSTARSSRWSIRTWHRPARRV